jgi:hypothetical protein
MRGGLTEGANLSSFGIADAALQDGEGRDTRRARLHGPFARAWKALIAGTRHAIIWGDSAKHGGRFVPNAKTGKVPSGNLITFSTGPIVNESGGSTPTRTTHHVTWTDVDGTTSATRLLSTSTNQALFLYRFSTCPAIPAGTYGIRCRMRASPGTGPWTVNIGNTTPGLTACTVEDLDWEDPANRATTTFEASFVFNGSAGDFVIRPAANGADILVDRIQIYYGGTASIPAWHAEVIEGGRKGHSFARSIPLDQDRNWNIAVDSGGGWILEPQLADVEYEEMTVMHAAALEDLDSPSSVGYCVAFPSSTRLGILITDFSVGFELVSAPYNGQVRMFPENDMRPKTSFQALDQGMILIGQALSSAGARHFVNEIPVLEVATPWGPFTTNRWYVGAGTTSLNHRAHIDTNEVVGKHALTFIWDRALTNEEYAEAAILVQQYLKGRLDRFRDFHVLSGDSNWTKGTNDWTQLISDDSYFTPKHNLYASNTSVGGHGLDQIEGVSGRLALSDGPKMLAAAKAGRKCLYHLGVGTNDFPEMVGGGSVASYLARLQAVLNQALQLHSNIDVMYYTILARGTSSGDSYTPANRVAVNAAMIAWAASHPSGRVYVCDVGGSASVLGDQAQVDGANIYLQGDRIHLNSTGDAAFALIAKASIQAWRTAVGV